MRRGRPKGSRNKTSGANPERKTPVKLDPIPRLKSDGKIHEAWKIMEEYIAKKPCFERLRNANLRIYWTTDWKPDVDKVVIGAAVSKASERERLDAEKHEEAIPDAQIILPKTVWPTLSDVEKRHRIFHELCHISFSKNANGEVKRTTKNWSVVRLRRHPIVAFHEEVEEFGIEAVLGRNGQALKALEDADRPLLAAAERVAANLVSGNGESVEVEMPSTAEVGDDGDGDSDMETRALALSNSGMGMKKIAGELGVSERQVRKLLGKL